MKSIITFLFFIGISSNGFSQAILKAKIVANSSNFESIVITNTNSKIKVNADIEGYFSIFGQPNDILQISGENCITLETKLKDEDFTKKLLFIRLKTTNQSKTIQLAEVEIKNYQNINAVSLGILSKPAKKYTPAERRLRTATGLDYSLNVGTMAGGSMSLDPLINKITGRTNRLKKELNIEINERLLLKLDSYFTKEYYTKNLKIPENYINGFQIYALDDARVVNALRDKNKTLVAFAFADLSSKYLAIIQ